MSSVKGAPSASAVNDIRGVSLSLMHCVQTLAVEASKVGGRSEDAEPIGYMNISRSNSGVVEITSSGTQLRPSWRTDSCCSTRRLDNSRRCAPEGEPQCARALYVTVHAGGIQ